ncbi:proline utilization protein PrnX [Xylariaceae sp. FL0804]|nr:proline utilization protein PrnX [Xylariaceae sp. FL0804]
MLILGAREVRQVLVGLSVADCHELLDALSASLAAYSTGRGAADAEPAVHQPLRSVFTTSRGHTSLFMPASDTARTGVKAVTLPGGGGAPRGAIAVFAPEGDLAGLLNAEEVTAFRTALASMVALLRSSSGGGGGGPPAASWRRIAVFGAGKQAEWHIRLALLLLLLPGGGDGDGDAAACEIAVVNRGSARLRSLREGALADVVGARYPDVTVRLVATDDTPDWKGELGFALADADAIFCCTPSTEPLFSFADLTAGGEGKPDKRRFISLIGSYKPNMQEVDAATLLSGGRVYVDSREACLEEAGEIIKAGVPPSKLVEVGEAIAQGENRFAEDTVVFKCVGMGIMDVVIASELLKMARSKGVGYEGLWKNIQGQWNLTGIEGGMALTDLELP